MELLEGLPLPTSLPTNRRQYAGDDLAVLQGDDVDGGAEEVVAGDGQGSGGIEACGFGFEEYRGLRVVGFGADVDQGGGVVAAEGDAAAQGARPGDLVDGDARCLRVAADLYHRGETLLQAQPSVGVFDAGLKAADARGERDAYARRPMPIDGEQVVAFGRRLQGGAAPPAGFDQNFREFDLR